MPLFPVVGVRQPTRQSRWDYSAAEGHRGRHLTPGGPPSQPTPHNSFALQSPSLFPSLLPFPPLRLPVSPWSICRHGERPHPLCSRGRHGEVCRQGEKDTPQTQEGSRSHPGSHAAAAAGRPGAINPRPARPPPGPPPLRLQGTAALGTMVGECWRPRVEVAFQHAVPTRRRAMMRALGSGISGKHGSRVNRGEC